VTQRSNAAAIGVAGIGLGMLNSFAHGRRVFGTGLGFAAVGVGGIFIFPLLNLFLRRREARAAVARDVIGFAFRCIVRSMQALGVFVYDVKGLEKLDRRGLLILANHPTLIDIIFLMAFVKRSDCIVKSALWRNPFTHCTVRAAAYVRNDDDGTHLVEDCVAAVGRGSNLIIFPEGTRTPAGGAIRLKRGAANIAVRAMRNITPVLIRCTPTMLGKGSPWWRLPARPSYFDIEVQDDIDIRPFVYDAVSEGMAARRLTEYLQAYFSRECSRHAAS
jgi:1-acyl-sn-glycerol-3-phosphate acyltransferase